MSKITPLTDKQKAVIETLSPRYIWWEPTSYSLTHPYRFVAQIMDLGALTDVVLLLEAFDEDYLRKVLSIAVAGWFQPESWAYWHYKLHLVSISDALPVMPPRVIKVDGELTSLPSMDEPPPFISSPKIQSEEAIPLGKDLPSTVSVCASLADQLIQFVRHNSLDDYLAIIRFLKQGDSLEEGLRVAIHQHQIFAATRCLKQLTYGSSALAKEDKLFLLQAVMVVNIARLK